MSVDQPSEGAKVPRAKRARRDDTGRKIVVRVTDDEHARLVLEAGAVTLSTYVRKRVFAGKVRRNGAYDRIAALHGLGRSIERAAAAQPLSEAIMSEVLDDIRKTIDYLAIHVPDDGEPE